MGAGRSSRAARWALWVLGAVVVLAGAFAWLVQANAAVIVERGLRSAGLSVVQRGGAELDIIGGDLLLNDWAVEVPGQEPGTRSHGAFDTLTVRGFSKFTWLFDRRFVAEQVIVVLDSLVWCGSPARTDPGKSSEVRSFGGAQVAHARVHIGAFHSRGADGQQLGIAQVLGELHDLHWSPDSIVGALVGGQGSVRTGKWLSNGKEIGPLLISSIRMDRTDHGLALQGVTFGEDSTIEHDAARLAQEADIITVRVDTLQVAGIRGTQEGTGGQWNADRILVSGARIHVARDKRLPDQAFRHVPLIAGILRALPVGSGVDTVELNRIDVTYHERAERGAVYGRLPFHHIHGTITGLRHFADTTSTVLHAEGFVFDTAQVRLDLRTSSSDSSDRFTAQAWLRGMPFADMAPMLAPLTGVTPVGGWLRDVRMTMEGNDRTGRGVVRMRYQELKLEMNGKGGNEVTDAMGSMLLNAVVRKQPREHAERDREGAFTMERRRDRSVFNMLWRCLREGATNIMLPEAMAGKE